jgi:signal transduction histidine kinase
VTGRTAAPLPSIGARITRAMLLWTLLWGAALGAAVWLAVQHEVDELLDDSLRAAAETVIAPLLLQGAAVAAAPHAVRADERFAWQRVAYRGAESRVLQASPAAPAQPLQATASAGFADVPGWRVYGVPVAAAGEPVQMLYVAQTRAERREAQLEVALSVALATLAMLLLALVLLGARIRHELRPLQALSARLLGHDPLQRGATLGAADRAELQPVHEAIDTLAARLAERVQRERAFSAHAAHALRTPLAGIDAQLAVALREAPPPLQPRLQRVRDAAARLQRVVVALLGLFRSGAALERRPLDLAALVQRLPLQGLALEVPPGASVQADADLLSAALANLLDNALRHGARHARLSVPAPGVLRLEDDGPGVDAARRAVLQDAVATQQYEGRTGLGLMLADQVARAHGGALVLPPVAAGFAVELHLAPAPTHTPGRAAAGADEETA